MRAWTTNTITEMLMSTRELILAAFRTMLRGPQFLHNFLTLIFGDSTIAAAHQSHLYQEERRGKTSGREDAGKLSGLATYLLDIERLFDAAVHLVALRQLSTELQKQFKASLHSNVGCMLPSYNHALPTGNEKGTYLALDMGGSTFRVALIELVGKGDEKPARILSLRSWKIGNEVKSLRGHAFFDWMAGKIEETVLDKMGSGKMEATFPMGLAWSFPIEQTSLRSGLLMEMGKGFLAAQDLLGHDLGELIQSACSRRSLSVSLEAIVNDSSATLLSKAYEDPSTRFALILGTGVNAAVHLPVSSFGMAKFGVRPQEWHAAARHVLVNTELSMFGGGVLPITRWDTLLNDAHCRPGYQPFEYLVSGRYMGEIVRLVVLEGVEMGELFGGEVPAALTEEYSLDTETLSLLSEVEGEAAVKLWMERTGSRGCGVADVEFVRRVAELVARRASAFLAVGVHALWALRNETEAETEALAEADDEILFSVQDKSEIEIEVKDMSDDTPHMVVSYNGSVLEHYPGFRDGCQGFLDGLVGGPGLELRPAVESSLLGAAVAVACVDI